MVIDKDDPNNAVDDAQGAAAEAGEETTLVDLPLPDPVLVKEAVPLFCCNLCDKEVVHKIAQHLHPGLAAACIDNTTGLFRSPASVAVPFRKELVEYLTQRSETYVAESLVQDDGGGADRGEDFSDDPADIASELLDDFARTKRNFFSRVSGWILSDSREDKIDDFVQEMEDNAFWSIDRREAVAETVLRNVDYKNEFHCAMKLETPELLEEHRSGCGFRAIECENEACRVKFSAVQAAKHDGECPYKVIPCEQGCPESILRREMDRHCITVCTMKLVNCPFHQVGCQSAVPQSVMAQHREEALRSHLVGVLRVIHKQLPEEELERRAELLENSESESESEGRSRLCKARDTRSLTNAVKEEESRLKLNKRGFVTVLE